MFKRCVTGLVLLIVVVGAVSCARQSIRGQTAPGLDRKLSTFAWIEEGDIATLIVGTRAARLKDKDAYFPLELAIANRGLRVITITRESFVLVDAEGNRYPAAGPEELMENYEFLDFDRNLQELQEIVFNRFAAFTRYPSQFSPTRQAGPRGGSSLVRDRVSLSKFGYLIDYVYFPTPPTGLLGKKLELWMTAPELEQPVFVRFMVE